MATNPLKPLLQKVLARQDGVGTPSTTATLAATAVAALSAPLVAKALEGGERAAAPAAAAAQAEHGAAPAALQLASPLDRAAARGQQASPLDLEGPFERAAAQEERAGQPPAPTGGRRAEGTEPPFDRAGAHRRALQERAMGQHTPRMAPTVDPLRIPLRESHWLREGSAGHQVEKLQRMMNDRAGARLAEDGLFGPRTAAVVSALKGRWGWGNDVAVVGPNFAARLNHASRDEFSGAFRQHLRELSRSPAPAPAPHREPFELGDAGTRADGTPVVIARPRAAPELTARASPDAPHRGGQPRRDQAGGPDGAAPGSSMPAPSPVAPDASAPSASAPSTAAPDAPSASAPSIAAPAAPSASTPAPSTAAPEASAPSGSAPSNAAPDASAPSAAPPPAAAPEPQPAPVAAANPESAEADGVQEAADLPDITPPAAPPAEQAEENAAGDAGFAAARARARQRSGG